MHRTRAHGIPSVQVAVLLGLALTACGGKHDTGKDWSGVALEDTVTSNIGNVMFDLKLPKGWKADDVGKSDVSREWRPDVKDYFSEPGVQVLNESSPPKTLAIFVGEGFDPMYTVEHKEMTGDYFIASGHTKDNGTLLVKLVRTKGDHSLLCSAMQAKTGGVPNPKATLEWLEKLCQTLTIK